MDLTKISTDTLRNVCDFLLGEGLVSEEQFLQIAASRPSNELKRAVDFIHSCLCLDDHEAECQYYIEEQRTDCWLSPAHIRWLEETTSLMSSMGLSESSLIMVFSDALCLVRDYDRLDPSAKTAFKKLHTVLAL